MTIKKDLKFLEKSSMNCWVVLILAILVFGLGILYMEHQITNLEETLRVEEDLENDLENAYNNLYEKGLIICMEECINDLGVCE